MATLEYFNEIQRSKVLVAPKSDGFGIQIKSHTIDFIINLTELEAKRLQEAISNHITTKNNVNRVRKN